MPHAPQRDAARPLSPALSPSLQGCPRLILSPVLGACWLGPVGVAWDVLLRRPLGATLEGPAVGGAAETSLTELG